MDTKRSTLVNETGVSSPTSNGGVAELPSTSMPKTRMDYGATEISSPPTNPSIPPIPNPNYNSHIRPNPRADLPPDFSLAAIFRYHIGIEHDEILVPTHLAGMKAIDPIATGKNHGRRAVNLGIYNRAIREERSAIRLYYIWTFIINGSLGLQIIFAAILTALGAGKGPSDAVAIFGALNTIIAGFLTYLKGTGLPMRMKYFHNQWLKLRAYIEQRERDFASDDFSRVHRLGYDQLIEEIDIVENMYHNIRKDIEKHTPDSYAGKGRDEATGPGEGAPESSLALKGLNALRNKLGGHAQQQVNDASHHAESRFKGALHDIESQITSRLSKLEGHIENNKTQGSSSGASKAKALSSDGQQTTVVDDMDEQESGLHDVTDEALTRSRQLHMKALEAQRTAEARVKELEDRLAATSGSSTQKESSG